MQVVLLIGLVLTVAAQRGEAASIVYPTGVFPDDLQNVQAAVDRGGTVLLKATDSAGRSLAFNFGPPDHHLNPNGQVWLTADVAIIGERVGSNMTTIQGGYHPFAGVVPVKSRIQGINFESPLGSAITIVASTGTEILENRINAVVPIPLSVGFTFGDGIDIFGDPDDPNAISGPVTVSDNVIDNLEAEFSIGIQLDEVAPQSVITGNSIGTNHVTGIGVFRSRSPVLIARNVLTGGPEPTSAGIWVGSHSEATYHVVGNTVVTQNPFSDGIIVMGGNDFGGPTVAAVIEQNHVTMHNSWFGGISLYGEIRDSLIAENIIDGDAAFALQAALNPFETGTLATSNRFQGNNVSRFTTSVADVLFDVNAQNNVLVGHCKSLIDIGLNNGATCATPLRPARIGQQIRDAREMRAAWLRSLMWKRRQAPVQ